MITYQNVQIVYFSGTGNSRQLALWFAEAARNLGLECTVSDMPEVAPKALKLSEETLLLLISPVHAFNFPKITLDFIGALPHGGGKVGLIAARGGMKVGNVLTPGLSGAAFWFNSWRLKRKGYKVVAEIPFDLPANCQLIYPAQGDAGIELMFEKSRTLANEFAERLFRGETLFLAKKDIAQDVLLGPVALGYYGGGRFSFAKGLFASSACIRCWHCAKVCPFKAIENKSGRPFWLLKCQSCMKCMHNCPKDAIEAGHGLVLATILVTILLAWFGSSAISPHLPRWASGIVIFFAGMSLVQIILYRVQHFLLGIPAINRLITRFSLSNYKFWGRYRRGGKQI